MGQIGGWSDQLDLEWWTNLQAFHWVTFLTTTISIWPYK